MERLLPSSGLQFLGPPSTACQYESARGLIVPVAWEATTSYGQGTRNGPQAILEASQQVELYDHDFDCEGVLHYGLHTLETLTPGPDPGQAIDQITQRVAAAAATGKLVGVLGGEHSLSLGVARGLHQALGHSFTIVQLDAHSDLRQEYEGTPYSHACVARRLFEEPWVEQILQVGIRSVCPEEVGLVRQHPDRLRVWTNEEVHQRDWLGELRQRIQGRRLFVTLDVDGLDPGVVPATGTPEPDGLSWRQTLSLLRCLSSQVIGFDCVELAPIPGQHYSDYAVAKLIYKFFNMLLLNKTRGDDP